MELISDLTFWPLNSDLIPSYPLLKTDMTCVVLIFGKGIMVGLCAYHMTKAGMESPEASWSWLAKRKPPPDEAVLRGERLWMLEE